MSLDYFAVRGSIPVEEVASAFSGIKELPKSSFPLHANGTGRVWVFGKNEGESPFAAFVEVRPNGIAVYQEMATYRDAAKLGRLLVPILQKVPDLEIYSEIGKENVKVEDAFLYEPEENGKTETKSLPTVKSSPFLHRKK